MPTSHEPWDSCDTSPLKLEDVKLPPHIVSTEETRKYYREYLAEIRLFDSQVGKAEKLLEELAIADNTIRTVFRPFGAKQLPLNVESTDYSRLSLLGILNLLVLHTLATFIVWSGADLCVLPLPLGGRVSEFYC